MSNTELYKIIESGAFWTLPEDEILVTIRDTFPDELTRLQRAYSLIPTLGPALRPNTPCISDRLYGKKFDEINRTLVGVLSLRWLRNADYDIFVGEARSPVTLKFTSFNWMREVFMKELQTPDDIFALVVSMITNDLGKDPNLAKDYAALKGIDISRVNHDMILFHAVEADMVPALRLLPKEYLQYIKTGIKLGSDFNFGQLAQAENAPASLVGLRNMKGQDRAFTMRFMEQVLDLSGASGHEDWTCARKMIEPIFQSYKNVYDVALGIISGAVSLRDGYDTILTRKHVLLTNAGFRKELDIKSPEGRAMLRLFCMGNASNEKLATIYDTAFNSKLSTEAREKLIYALNVDGSVGEPAVQPTYAPAMFTKACNNTVPGISSPVDTVTAMMEYLAKVLTITKEELEQLPEGVTVVERDIRCIEGVVTGQDFRHRPSVLVGERVPDAVVANMAE